MTEDHFMRLVSTEKDAKISAALGGQQKRSPHRVVGVCDKLGDNLLKRVVQ